MHWIIQLPNGQSHRLGFYDSGKTYSEYMGRDANQNLELKRFELEWHVDTSTDAYGNMVAYKRERDDSNPTRQVDGPNNSPIQQFGSRIKEINYNFSDTVWDSHQVAGPFNAMGHLYDQAGVDAATRIGMNMMESE